MKKMLFLAVTLLLSTAIYAQSDELLGFVPADIDGFACLNFKELASHPKIREAIEKNDDQQFMKFKDELKTNGIDIFNSCTNGIIFFNASSKKGGAVIKTGVNEDTFNKISASSLADGSMKKTVLAGKVLYVFEKGSERTALTYLKPDIVGISDQPEETVKLASLEKSSGVSSNEKLMAMSGTVSSCTSHASMPPGDLTFSMSTAPAGRPRKARSSSVRNTSAATRSCAAWGSRATARARTMERVLGLIGWRSPRWTGSGRVRHPERP